MLKEHGTLYLPSILYGKHFNPVITAKVIRHKGF